MTREEARTQIEKIGLFPGIRVNSRRSGPVLRRNPIRVREFRLPEIPMTVPDAVEIIRRIAHEFPDMVVVVEPFSTE